MPREKQKRQSALTALPQPHAQKAPVEGMPPEENGAVYRACRYCRRPKCRPARAYASNAGMPPSGRPAARRPS